MDTIICNQSYLVYCSQNYTHTHTHTNIHTHTSWCPVGFIIFLVCSWYIITLYIANIVLKRYVSRYNCL